MSSELCEEVDNIKGSYLAEAVGQITVEEVLKCNSPIYVTVDKAARLLANRPELIANPRENFAALDALIDHIESRIFFAGATDELVFDLRGDRRSVKLVNDAYCSWETALEQIFVKRLCGGSVSSLNEYRLNNRFQRLLKRELSMLKGTAPRRALFIGSGPFPISAIWMHRQLKIPVDGLDVSGDAIERSQRLIDSLHLSDAIKLIHQRSADYDVSEYDVIIIALLAKPKARILENIHRTAKPDCDIVCRTSFGLRSVVYEPTLVTPDILERFSIEDARVVSGASDDTISSLLLRKII